MKTITKISAIAILMIGFHSNSFAQASATATASATIITPISIAKTVDMNFGNAAVQTGTGGTIVLTPAGGRTVTGGVTLPVVTGTVSAASFTVTGSGTSTYSITLPATCTITSGVNTMIVNTFTSTPTPTGTLVGGTETLLIGATLNVSAAQAPGTYLSGTPFSVTVNYN